MRHRKACIFLFFSLFMQACQIVQENQFSATDSVAPTETRISEHEIPTSTDEETDDVLGTEATVAPFCNTSDYETELPDPDVPENYIGRYFGAWSTFPEELTFLVGQCIGIGCTHGYTVIRKENSFMIWIDEVVCHDTNGRSKGIIIDAVETPPLQETEMHSPESFCWDQNGRLYHVFAVGRFDHDDPSIYIDELWDGAKGWYLEEIIFAVRIDTATMRFVDITDFDIGCAYIENAYGE